VVNVYLVINIGCDVNEKMESIAALLGALEEIGFAVHMYLGGWGGKTAVSVNGVPVDLDADIDEVIERVVESLAANMAVEYVAASA